MIKGNNLSSKDGNIRDFETVKSTNNLDYLSELNKSKKSKGAYSRTLSTPISSTKPRRVSNISNVSGNSRNEYNSKSPKGDRSLRRNTEIYEKSWSVKRRKSSRERNMSLNNPSVLNLLKTKNFIFTIFIFRKEKY